MPRQEGLLKKTMSYRSENTPGMARKYALFVLLAVFGLGTGLAQDAVAGEVSERVVDVLKVIEVGNDQAEGTG